MTYYQIARLLDIKAITNKHNLIFENQLILQYLAFSIYKYFIIIFSNYNIIILIDHLIQPIIFAGTPVTILFSGTSFVTTAPAPITAPVPI